MKSTPAEILYGGRDPYSHKIFIDLGDRQGVQPGSPVADEAGVRRPGDEGASARFPKSR